MVCCPGLVSSEFHGANWQGPPQMSAADVVTASLRGLEMDEGICIPGLEDPQGVEDLQAAQRELLGHARSTTLATRYR
jgi:uncharacterized protein